MRKNTRRLRVIFFLLVTFGVFSLLNLIGSILPNAFFFSKTLKANITYFLPQGWAFFTRNAREEKILIFKKEDDGSLSQIDLRASSSIYYFGLDRSGRRLPKEYIILLNQAQNISWTSCDFDMSEIKANAKKANLFLVKNPIKKSRINGEIIFIKMNIKPWAWVDFPRVKMPCKFVKIFAYGN